MSEALQPRDLKGNLHGKEHGRFITPSACAPGTTFADPRERVYVEHMENSRGLHGTRREGGIVEDEGLRSLVKRSILLAAALPRRPSLVAGARSKVWLAAEVDRLGLAGPRQLQQGSPRQPRLRAAPVAPSQALPVLVPTRTRDWQFSHASL
jgi:hypothetical protein